MDKEERYGIHLVEKKPTERQKQFLEKHHILFPRLIWQLYPHGLFLRNTPALIPPIDREPHRELHVGVPLVPLLAYHGLARVRRGFETTGDTFKDISQLQSLIEETNNHPRTHGAERGLGELAIEALDEQIPFLLDGGVKRNSKVAI